MCIQGSIIVLEFPDDPTTDLFVGLKHHYSTLTWLSVAFVKWKQRSASFHPVLIPPKGQMMGMVSWQGILPNFTQSISCQSSLTHLDLMMEVGYEKP